MSVLFVLLPVALVLVMIAIAAFLWAARKGQFDDLTTPALRALHEDEPRAPRVGEAARSRPSSRPPRRTPGPAEAPRPDSGPSP